MEQTTPSISASMNSRFPDYPRPDPITVVPLALAALATLAAIPLLAARNWVLETVAIPVVERFFSDDGVIDLSSAVFLEQLLVNVGWMLLVAACLVLAWGRLGQHLPRHLNDRVHSAIHDTRVRGWWVPAVASTILVALSIPHMSRGFGYDEIFTTVHFVETASFWDTLSSYKLFNNHVAYSLLARIAWIVGGGSEAVLRVPALMLGIATLIATWRVGLLLVGRRASALAVLALACSPTMIAWSVSARGYTGLMACTSWALLAYLHVLRERGRPAAIQLAAALALGSWFHLYGVLVGLALGAHLVWLALTSASHISARAFRSTWWSLVGAGLASLLLYLPVLPQLLFNIAQRRAGSFQPHLPVDVLSELAGTHPGPLFIAIAALAIVGLVSVHKLEGARASCLVAIAVCPLLTLWIVVQPYDLYGRFFAYLLPTFLLLVTRGLLDLTPQRSAVLAAAIFLWPVGEWLNRTDSVILTEGYRVASTAILGDDEHASLPRIDVADHDVTIIAIGGGAELFSYYCDEPVKVVDTYIDFLETVKASEEIRCLHRPTSWQSDEHDAIAHWFESRGLRFDFGNVRAYVWTNAPTFASR